MYEIGLFSALVSLDTLMKFHFFPLAPGKMHFPKKTTTTKTLIFFSYFSTKTYIVGTH